MNDKKVDIEEKRKGEWKTVIFMIQIYCRKKHKNRLAMKNPENLCDECKELADYVHERILKCPFMETKTFCSACRVHCYKSDMRQRIRDVMRFSGPRMMLYHPILAVRHVITTVKMKKRGMKK